MGITGLIPFLEKASRRANISEFSGCTVAIDSYCWLHKGAFACADKLVRGEDTDVHIKYCMKYVTMLLSRNIKPILVFDGQHLPAKAATENKRRESRNISKKRAAELLSLGKIDEARSFMRRSVDITHAMALELIRECRKRNVDCIVAPYEADAQLAYLNINNIAHLVITEDSDLILFGCTKVLFKMDLDGNGTLVDTAKLPLVMKCPIEHYTFDKFRQMCIMSGCDYLASLPGIGLAKARQFVTATQDSNFANALRKLPSYFNRSNLVVTDEYRENFLKAEATFKHQYVYDPLHRKMVRLTEPDDDDIEEALCVNAGVLLDSKTAFQLALGNLDPFTLKKMDNWHPDHSVVTESIKTNSWKEKGISNHPSIWQKGFEKYLDETTPWSKKDKKEPFVTSIQSRPTKKVVTLVSKVVPETQDQDQSLSIETLSKMYCMEPANKKQKLETDSQCIESFSQKPHDIALIEENISDNTQKQKSPILENKERSFRKCLRNGTYSMLKKLSRFPRTIIDDDVIESKFFNNDLSKESSNTKIAEDESLSEVSTEVKSMESRLETDTGYSEIMDSQENSQKENFKTPEKQYPKSPEKQCSKSPILESSPRTRNPFRTKLNSQTSADTGFSQQSVIEDTFLIDSQTPVETSPQRPQALDKYQYKFNNQPNGIKKATCRVSGLKRPPLPGNQTLLSKFGFQKKLALKR